MLRKLHWVLLMSAVLSGSSMAQLRVPDLSPNAHIRQDIGMSSIEIEYSRPSARGRQVFGEDGLVPFGEVWRAGANAATKITLSDDFELNGQLLKKGTYAMLAKPSTEFWELEFYPYESENWLSYVPKTPFLVVKAEINKLIGSTETFTIGVEEVTLNSAKLVLLWENLKVTVPFKVEVDQRVMARIEQVMEGPGNNDYFQAALFMHERGIDLEQALGYIRKVTVDENALFFQVHREALILSDLERTEEAIEVAQRSLILSERAGNQDFVRLNKRLIDKLREQ
ncbi:DUF2911 domain-containing protein [Roseivirga sp.]|uniref:DUF2911 domain-containing protein n=1 Tax=Roseivirga sp. TaxID=1964215 RepID=UPI003B527062